MDTDANADYLRSFPRSMSLRFHRMTHRISWIVYAALLAACPVASRLVGADVVRSAPTLPGSTPWDLAALSRAPRHEWADREAPVRSLYYESVPYGGKSTRVFAYWATPGTLAGDTSLDRDLPAVVLVHGGGGTAFPQWAKLWAERGYAAIAMDLADRGADRKPLADGGPDQSDDTKFGKIDAPVTEQWTYHAVADVILAHSLVRSFPSVDAKRTAVTGISWGGYLTCIVAGLDQRFRAAVPVYGCGFLDEGSAWDGRFAAMTDAQREKWMRLWDPSRYVGSASMPVLFVNGTNDFAYWLESYAKTYALVAAEKRHQRITVRMPHGHYQGWAPKEIGQFIDQHLLGSKPLPRVASPSIADGRVRAAVDAATPLKRAALHFTAETAPSPKRAWRTLPASLVDGAVAADPPPKDAKVWFVTVEDERGAVVSSELVFPTEAPAKKPGKPNVVVILADDMGYGDVRALNPASKIPTPNLDRLAAQGIAFTDAHTPSAVCTPTRYGLLTGRYCWRSRLKRGVLFPPNDKPLIEPTRVTIANLLGAHGYRSACIGKWHLGIEWARSGDGKAVFDAPFTFGPTDNGFDTFFGVAASLDMVPYVFLRDHQALAKVTTTQSQLGFPRYIRRGPKAPDFDPGDALDVLAKEAGAFIRSSARGWKPFFLYLPLTAPHKPVWPHERFVGKTKLGPYGDFVHQVDHTVGEVLGVLDDAGVADDTLVVYTSDNGSFMFRSAPGEKDHVDSEGVQSYRPENHRANGPWRGTKADIWEGGHHVPFFVRWPAKVRAGTRCGTPISLTDVLATIADAVGVEVPAGAAEDSFSFLPYALGAKPATPRPPVIQQSGGGHFAIRDGDWKLVLSNGSGGRERPSGRAFAKPYFLANIAEDPGETTNRVDEHPDIAARLEAAFEKIAHGDHLGAGAKKKRK